MPTTSPSPSRLQRLRALVTARTWALVAAAFAIGVLLFALIWMKQRAKNDFFRVDEPQRSASGRELEPLPGPDTGRIATEAAPAAPTPAAPARAPAEAAPSDGGLPMADDSGTSPADGAPLETFGPTRTLEPRDGAPASRFADSPPVPVTNPAPRYPSAALRRGDAGEVLLRVHVGTDGLPKQIDLVDGSGSGLLDRAATEAMRGWRFRPAMRNGQPVEGTVQVPIRFTPGR